MSFRLKAFYFMIVSFASLIGVAITSGIIIFSSAQQVFISDDEYLLSYNSYEIRQCDEPRYLAGQDEPTIRTPQEITACKAEATRTTFIQRSLNFKESLLGGFSWGLVFLAIFLFHFPVFRRLSDKN